MPAHSVSQLLVAWREGNQEALDRLLPLVYEELRLVAAKHMRAERTGHTLQATALVHEVYARLLDADVEWRDRSHFFAVAARMMRRILVDHAKAKGRSKRGGGAARITLEETVLVSDEGGSELLDLDEALTRLAGEDQRKADIVELHFFGGLTYAETAEAVGVSPATVDRELRAAKEWLYRELQDGAAGDG